MVALNCEARAQKPRNMEKGIAVPTSRYLLVLRLHNGYFELVVAVGQALEFDPTATLGGCRSLINF